MNNPSKKKPMVGWYDPGLLLNTGVQVLVSQLLGTRIDARREEALAGQEKEKLIDYADNAELWFDFMADTGDGWDSTFRMAQLVSQTSLRIANFDLPRGKFLVLGGDEIYPFASKQAYQERLVQPFEAASPRRSVPGDWELYVIPGNHDWYDGLVSFLHQFTQERRIGSWCTKQKRSYFAMKLPQRWWLWAVDTQLEADLDQPQVDYFKKRSDEMQNGDRLIVCIPEPDWLYGKMLKDENLLNNLNFLLNDPRVLGDKKITVFLTLSGDLHHYRRHEHVNDTRQQKIVAGGGGAFLHPTHKHDIEQVDVYGERFVRKAEFPATSTCWWLTWLNLVFPIFNPRFGTITAIFYLLFGWQMTRIEWNCKFLLETIVWQHPVTLVCIAGIYVLCYRFTNEERPGAFLFRWLWGTLIHGSAHVLAVWLIAFQLNHWFGADLADWRTAIYRFLGFLIAGYVVGSLIMGFYLAISLNVWQHHHNEAFSALRIKHYKNFLRLHIRRDGALEIFPIGVPRLSKPPILIEGPVTINPA